MKPSAQSLIVMIGSDPSLEYLIRRYAEQSDYRVIPSEGLTFPIEIRATKPVAAVFLSLESLETAQALMSELANQDIPVVVCSSVSDESRARELGADHCLLHPLTYPDFLATLEAACSPEGS